MLDNPPIIDSISESPASNALAISNKEPGAVALHSESVREIEQVTGYSEIGIGLAVVGIILSLLNGGRTIVFPPGFGAIPGADANDFSFKVFSTAPGPVPGYAPQKNDLWLNTSTGELSQFGIVWATVYTFGENFRTGVGAPGIVPGDKLGDLYFNTTAYFDLYWFNGASWILKISRAAPTLSQKFAISFSSQINTWIANFSIGVQGQVPGTIGNVPAQALPAGTYTFNSMTLFFDNVDPLRNYSATLAFTIDDGASWTFTAATCNLASGGKANQNTAFVPVVIVSTGRTFVVAQIHADGVSVTPISQCVTVSGTVS